jgi:hypothetical protein
MLLDVISMPAVERAGKSLDRPRHEEFQHRARAHLAAAGQHATVREADLQLEAPGANRGQRGGRDCTGQT